MSRGNLRKNSTKRLVRLGGTAAAAGFVVKSYQHFPKLFSLDNEVYKKLKTNIQFFFILSHSQQCIYYSYVELGSKRHEKFNRMLLDSMKQDS